MQGGKAGEKIGNEVKKTSGESAREEEGAKADQGACRTKKSVSLNGGLKRKGLVG